jgi:hypothetical protein
LSATESVLVVVVLSVSVEAVVSVLVVVVLSVSVEAVVSVLVVVVLSVSSELLAVSVDDAVSSDVVVSPELVDAVVESVSVVVS